MSSSTKAGSSRRKPAARNSTATRKGVRAAAGPNDAPDGQTTPARKAGTRISQKQAGGPDHRSPPQSRQAKSVDTVRSASKQRIGASFKLDALLGSPLVRRLVAAGLISAGAALIYRKPEAVTAANEKLQTGAAELVSGAVGVARGTTKAARKVRRKAVAVVEAATETSAPAEEGAPTAQLPSSRLPNTLATEVATNTIEQRTRKRRSDAGLKRASRKSMSDPGASIGSNPEPSPSQISVGAMETSAFVFGADRAQPASEAAPTQGGEEEIAAEAHPS
jgi:hypothetical protein